MRAFAAAGALESRMVGVGSLVEGGVHKLKG